jgi:hypothetical protein
LLHVWVDSYPGVDSTVACDSITQRVHFFLRPELSRSARRCVTPDEGDRAQFVLILRLGVEAVDLFVYAPGGCAGRGGLWVVNFQPMEIASGDGKGDFSTGHELL